MMLHGIMLAALALVWAPQDEVPKLIRQLGAESSSARQKAGRELLRIGESALPALKKATEDKDPEIASRARRLVEEIQKQDRGKPERGKKPKRWHRTFTFNRSTPEYSLSVGPEGVKLKEKASGKTYTADSIEEFRRKHPEQAGQYLKKLWSYQGPMDPEEFRRRMRKRFHGRHKDVPKLEDLPPEVREFLRRRHRPDDHRDRSLRRRARGPCGARLGRVGETLREQLGLAASEGVLVRRVQEGSPGERAGLRQSDVIVAFDGAPVENPWKLRILIAKRLQSGQDFEITVLRKGERIPLKVSLGSPNEQKEKPDKEK